MADPPHIRRRLIVSPCLDIEELSFLDAGGFPVVAIGEEVVRREWAVAHLPEC